MQNHLYSFTIAINIPDRILYYSNKHAQRDILDVGIVILNCLYSFCIVVCLFEGLSFHYPYCKSCNTCNVWYTYKLICEVLKPGVIAS